MSPEHLLPEHLLPKLEGVTNFRELGGIDAGDGLRVARGRIFRSGHWGGATDADVALLRELGVGRVFDFRSEHDLSHDGIDRLPEGVEHVFLPTVDPAVATDLRAQIAKGGRDALRELFGNGGAVEFMKTGAAGLVTERVETYRAFLHGMAAPGSPPVLFHCSAGKDRAGWAGSCVLLVLGVDEEAVVEHYLQSNEHYEPTVQGYEQFDEEIVELLSPLVAVRPEYIRASIDAVHTTFGSFEKYFREALGIGDEERERLRRNWLEEI